MHNKARIDAICDNLELVVGAHGNILSAGTYGLLANVGISTEVVNNGTISSAQSTGVGLFASDTSAAHTLVNAGTILGEDYGVRIEARGLTSTISNSGVIAGGDRGISAGQTTDAVLEVWNTGTISGGNYSFIGNSDDGSGTSSDRVHNAGLMQGDIALLSGDDLYDGIGGLVLGTVDGGAGNDTLIGGAGADTFIYTSAAQSPFGGNIDIIRDFTSGEDQIDLSDIVGPDLVFIGPGSFSGTQGEVRYVTNAKGNASVFADTDGDGTADLRIFLVNVQSLDQGDFLL